MAIFPAGVDESDDKRGDPKNAKRRMTRRTRITLARRAARKRKLRLALIQAGLLPQTEDEFVNLIDSTDPWELRRKGLDSALSPHEFGRVLLHLAQRRGALGLNLPDPDDEDAENEAEDGKVKRAIGEVRARMLERKTRTFGEYIAKVREERVHPLTSEDRRPPDRRRGERAWRAAVRNKAASYEHCADRAMIRDEFCRLWNAQRRAGGQTAHLLTDELRRLLDDESGDHVWRHKGLLFGQRRQSWDLGTLGRCTLEPTERCAPHADMYASRYLVVETVNNLRIIERGKAVRALTTLERDKILAYLSGPLGVVEKGKQKGQPKRSVTVTDLRQLMGWGRATKTTAFRFNIESDEDRLINTDWFSREIVHGAVTPESWAKMPERIREGLNRALLKFDPDQDGDEAKLRIGASTWAGLNANQAETLVAAWRRRPKPDAKRLNISRKAVRNLLTIMDPPAPLDQPDAPRPWLTEIQARKQIAENGDFCDATTGQPFDDLARRRYATGAKGATARDRYYMRKHVLMKDGKPVMGPDGKPLAEPPPAPLISNPVVRKAIHEVRRHIVEYMTTFGRKPDEVYIELAREARMGKKDADFHLFRNRLRNRIRRDILVSLDLEGLTSTQQRAAVDRVVLCVQQNGACPLCGKGGLTDRQAANGDDCEVAHIIPRASGGHNGLSNIVLAHRKCNRDMGRRTPRQFWSDGAGFDQGIGWVESIYAEVSRPKPSEMKGASGPSLWACYFGTRDDRAKIDQFKKDVKDIQEMTARQEAATKYAARQVMAYIADALYEGKGLPERGGERRIYATDGLWTSRLRREWGLFFDPHDRKAKGLSVDEEHIRKEKDRGDHRHHAIDAVIIALTTAEVRIAWDKREREADLAGVNTADESEMDAYRRANPLPPPSPYKSREEFRDAVREAVYGDGGEIKPVCHRPVKRKLIGALHEETLFGPIVSAAGSPTNGFTAKKSVLALTSNHLRMPEEWDDLESRLREASSEGERRSIGRRLAALTDPPPGKSGIVRDRNLRADLRRCLRSAGVDPDNFGANQIKKLHESGGVRLPSGVPVRSVVLLRTMNDPVLIPRRRPVYGASRTVVDGRPASLRAYIGGNNHHIEIRVAKDKKGNDLWNGEVVSAFEAGQRKLARLRAFREAGLPSFRSFRALSKEERRRHAPALRAVEQAHPIVDRRDDPKKGGRFVMSLSEGETLYMLHKDTGEPGYFVVAKLDKPRSIVVAPHWDARSATERKDSDGRRVPDSQREQFSVTPSDLKTLAPPGHAHAVKVHVSPLGVVTALDMD
ncbi:MAG: HNH endonuclease [Phycisphaerales bacterium]|nr:HNH endonuclease [Phycisphaerales bacterium]